MQSADHDMTPIEVTRALFEDAWSRGEFGSVEGWFTEVVRYHSSGMSRDTSLDDLRTIVGRWREAFGDLTFRIDDLVVADTSVAVRATLQGTQRGEWMGVAPAGAKMSVPHAFFFRFERGLLSEVWEFVDRDLMRRQLGG